MKKKVVKKIIISFILSSLCSLNVHSQIINEQIVFTTDRQLYISGEKIVFNAFCIDNGKFTESSISKVLNIEMYDLNSKPIFQKKFKISKGKSSGYITIPSSLYSGYYLLVVYTKYLHNFGKNSFISRGLTIVNPNYPMPVCSSKIDKSTDNTANIDTGSNSFNKQKVKYEEINLKTEKEIYKRRELVNVKLSKLNDIEKSAYMTMYVVKHGTNRNKFDVKTCSSKLHNRFIDTIKNKKTFFVPEVRNVSIEGFLKDKISGEVIPNALIYTSVLEGRKHIYINKTNNKGEFFISPNLLSNNKDFYLCTDKMNNENSEIFIKNDFLNNYTDSNIITVTLNSNHKKLLDEMLFNSQVDEVFISERDTKKIIKESFSNIQFGNPEYSITLKEFIKLPTLHEVFNEIIPCVKIKIKRGKYLFNVFNEKNNISYENPLVLLDGIPIFNNKLIMKIKPTLIKKIEVINRLYILGDHFLNGIISIHTKTNNFAGIKIPDGSKIIKFQTYTTSNYPKFSQYNTKEKRNSRTPDFGNLMFYQSNIVLSEQDKILDFYTSDSKGKYDIILKGVNSDGNILYGKKTVTIE